MEEGHERAKEQLEEIIRASEGEIEILGEVIDSSGQYVMFDITLPFQGAESVATGLPIRARERFLLKVHKGFPFEKPEVRVTHRRFAGFPHVLGVYFLCLYQAESDWKPEDGMYGLITRLDGWIRDAAMDNLDPDDAPLHPPIAYTTVDRLVIPAKDAPIATDEPWYGFAVLRERGKRTEIVDWVPLIGQRPESFAPAILLHQRFPFEFPRTVKELTDELERQGIQYGPFVWLLALAALQTESGTPLLMVLGTPMRRVEPGGPLLPHLAVWEIDASAVHDLLRLNALNIEDPRFEAMGQEALKKVVDWSLNAKIGWCDVREARPAVTKRRDQNAATTWFRHKTVEIWGCGAIGSRVAESIARAGARRLLLYDNGRVVPGLLVRQAFEDDDIGRWKAEALRDRILRIDPKIDIQAHVRNLRSVLDENQAHEGIDLLIDATGSSNLRTKLERHLRRGHERPPIASLGVSFDAQAAIATLALPNHSGGPSDLSRRLKLEACRRPEMSNLLESFWPEEARATRFQPEPGCSEPTFVGSDADLSTLAARMLNAVAEELSDTLAERTAAGWLFESTGGLTTFRWIRDTVIGRPNGRYQVRVSPQALAGMRAWARTSRRRHGPEPETGGLAFGEVNEAAGVLWVSEVEGPPPDSHASRSHFTCGVAGMTEANAEKRKRFRGSVACVGSWHTHPDSPAEPSNVDFGAVVQILESSKTSRRTCLLLILSGDPDEPRLGAHAFRIAFRTSEILALELTAGGIERIPRPQPGPRNVGLALSGGGSRAIAFHLGCFRALYDLGLLTRLQVISSVSGGSVLAAMYAYSNDEFADFDTRVVKLLRRGLVRDLALFAIRPWALVRIAASIAAVGTVSLLRTVGQLLPSSVRSRVPFVGPSWAPPRRLYSRTEAFRDALASLFFGERRVSEVERPSLDVVINATELRTGSAFRFGSQQSGCWRFGVLPDEQALVADAVAASAAYPALLPALDREYSFARSDGGTSRGRILLTDGGVFENLGVSPMEPGRDPSVSTNVFRPDFIISCDAGAGLLDDDAFPAWWPTRMTRSFLTTFRKVQDATRKRLHQLAVSREISGFVLSYLGQNDRALPWTPTDLPRRADVYLYPTDFLGVKEDDLNRLSLRGELLTRLLVSYYLPDL